MNRSSKTMKYSPVVLTAVVLTGIVLEGRARPHLGDADPFHARVYDAHLKMPSSFGDWQGSDVQVQPSAIALLRPNVILQRRYVNRAMGRSADFLVVQCRDARDMAGHYPPICYPANGWQLSSATRQTWDVGGRSVDGVEYRFSRIAEGRQIDCYVRNLIILPDGQLVSDIADVRSAAADYLRQMYGAAQIQVVMGDLPAEERDEITEQLLEPNLFMIDALGSGGSR